MIRDNLLRIRERISSICTKINCQPDSITIVAVSKGRAPLEIRGVIEAGITDIGENKIQEALVKYSDMRLAISDKPIKWHMVGHLQTNKVKEAVKIFDLIHSLDSLRLALEINKQAAKINKIQDVLIEIKTSPEATKFGLDPKKTIETIKEMAGLKNIKVRGLMTIAPVVANPDNARPYFRLLRELEDKINDMRYAICDMRLLSMGMTDDFEIAIEEGANLLRLGRAIFEG